VKRERLECGERKQLGGDRFNREREGGAKLVARIFRLPEDRLEDTL